MRACPPNVQLGGQASILPRSTHLEPPPPRHRASQIVVEQRDVYWLACLPLRPPPISLLFLLRMQEPSAAADLKSSAAPLLFSAAGLVVSIAQRQGSAASPIPMSRWALSVRRTPLHVPPALAAPIR